MAFDPKQHLISLKGKMYLECRWRIVWFRDDHPLGKVSTEVYSLDPLVIRATVLTAEGEVLATGHGSAQAKPGAVWSGREIEKAETAAISRALAHAGYGTQFSDDDDKNHLADSPVERRPPPQQQRQAPPPPPAQPASNVTQLQQPSAPKVVNGEAPEVLDEVFGTSTFTVTPGAKWADVYKLDIAKRRDGKGTYYRLYGLDAGNDSEVVITAFSKTLLEQLGFDAALTLEDPARTGYNIRVPYAEDSKNGKTFNNLDEATVKAMPPLAEKESA